MPHAARILAQTAREVTSCYNDIQAGLLARAQRRELERRREPTEEQRRALRTAIRSFIQEDPRLRRIESAHRAELARLLADAYLAEEDKARSARSFAEERVIRIALRVNHEEL